MLDHYSFLYKKDYEICIIVVAAFLAFVAIGSEYLNWDYSDLELAIAGTILHGAEFVFVRLASFILIGALIGIVVTYRKR